jgi:hypothetical protein
VEGEETMKSAAREKRGVAKRWRRAARVRDRERKGWGGEGEEGACREGKGKGGKAGEGRGVEGMVVPTTNLF